MSLLSFRLLLLPLFPFLLFLLLMLLILNAGALFTAAAL
jgi:hypothetical protein